VPVLDVWHTSIDQNGEPYELTRFVMRGDMTGLLYDVPRRIAVRRSAQPRIALLALIWGSAFLWIKLADRGFSPVEVVTLARLALGGSDVVGHRPGAPGSVPRSWRLWGHIAVAALFANAVPYLLFAVAEQSVNPSTAGIINATTPLWTVVLALAVRHQRTVTSLQAAGLVVGFAGGLLISEPWSTASGLTSAGALECLAASISYAVSYIYMDRFLAHRGLSPVTLSACQLLAASVMLAISLAVTGAQAPHFTAESVAAIAVLGIIGTGLAYVLNYQIITTEGATVASTVTYLLPVVAIVLGVIVLGKTVTVAIVIGIALVLIGTAVMRLETTESEENITYYEFRLVLKISDSPDSSLGWLSRRSVRISSSHAIAWVAATTSSRTLPTGGLSAM
jgi:drug/metabolite transporter (DMT)-like permease